MASTIALGLGWTFVARGLGKPARGQLQRLGRQRIGQMFAVPFHGAHVTPCHKRSRAAEGNGGRCRGGAALAVRRLCLYKECGPPHRIPRMTLDELRQHLSGLDRRLLELIAERQSTSREIARVKRATGYPTRDYVREREVILAVRAGAARTRRARGRRRGGHARADPLLARPPRNRPASRPQGAGSGQRALVIGGAGKIGGWFAQFLASQGFAVEIADPAGGAGALKDWRSSPLDHDYIVVAAPLGATNAILRELAERRPGGVIFDVGSLKTPLRGGLEALRAAGLRVTSIHPMFGPNTELLSGRHVVFIDLGPGDALERTRALFAPTMVEQVVMSLDEHDRLIAYVLGLSHAREHRLLHRPGGQRRARAAAGADVEHHLRCAVRHRQRAWPRKVPELYFEIQRLNEYGAESLDALAQAVDSLRSAVQTGDAARFTALMDAGREYTQGRAEPTQRARAPSAARRQAAAGTPARRSAP